MKRYLTTLYVFVIIFPCLGPSENNCQYKDDVFKIIIDNYKLSELCINPEGSFDADRMISALKGEVLLINEALL